MSQDVFVFIEAQHDAIRPVANQVVGVARSIAEARGGKVVGLLIGAGLEGLSSDAASIGVDRLAVVDHAALATYSAESYTTAVVGALEQQGGGPLFFGNTSIGKDIGPRIAHRLGQGMVSDVVAIEQADDKPRFRRPIYAGKAFCTVEVQEAEYVVSIRANSFPAAEAAASPAEVVPVEVNLDPATFKVQVKEVIERDAGQVDLTEADVIVSGGMGVKGPEGFEMLKPLAEVLGAAVGASRAAVLADFIHPSHQVGQTGKTVSPNLYIACGISGAVQHQAGMSTSKCIVAINTDADAPIFEIADYGIVGDAAEVVPALTEQLKKLLA
ncbi:MAG: electron transfer flavoprotein subunit alpha/FixB family protein [Planctomycetales bacterium]|nr:electron transfer flavoprotein subunit alpha/FixB family protein [Planctomycetales bacterium]